MYPLCITTSDNSIEELEFDGEIEAVVCVEDTERNALAFSVVESQKQYTLYVPELKVKNFICYSKKY